MPFVETTLIAGYGPEVKARLASHLTRSVLSVMNAAPEGVVVVFREVEPANWVRGGVSRTPGPPLPAAIEIVKAYLAAEAAGDADRAAACLGEGVAPAAAVGPLSFASFAEALTERGSLVFAEGSSADGARVLRRFHVVQGKVLAIDSWIDRASAG